MIRILGAITGSALALATLLVVIGVPQFKTESTENDRAIVTLPLPTSPVDRDDTRANIPVADSDAESAGAGDADTAGAAGRTTHTSSVVPTDYPAIAMEPPADAAISNERRDAAELHMVESQPVLDTPQSWYAFWSPFRSELAANGFVAQLQSVTGLDYRVVRVKPGVYEVAFAYQNDEDITTNLTQITAATGLELPQ